MILPLATIGVYLLSAVSASLSARTPATNNDGKGPYSHHQLWRMNARFVARVECAFASGKESRAAASASVIRRPPTP